MKFSPTRIKKRGKNKNYRVLVMHQQKVRIATLPLLPHYHMWVFYQLWFFENIKHQLHTSQKLCYSEEEMGSFAIYKRKAGFYLHITQSGLFFSIPLMSYSFLLVLLLLVFSNLGIRLYFYLILLRHCNFKTFLFCAMRPAIKFFSRTLSIGNKL